jgi:crossover junction endodeoxyribonuclease RusA
MTVEIRFDTPARLLSMNDRMHWRPKAVLTAAWVEASALAARSWRARRVWDQAPATVAITLPVRTSARRDPHNYFATVKPIIDGLVDAGLWPDDTPDWVTTTEPHLEVAPTPHRVTITITERT